MLDNIKAEYDSQYSALDFQIVGHGNSYDWKQPCWIRFVDTQVSFLELKLG